MPLNNSWPLISLPDVNPVTLVGAGILDKDYPAWDAATAKFLMKRGDGMFNVGDYGAVGNGTTDDTAAIQAAIDTMETAGGGIVELGPHTYKTLGTLTMLQGCLRGQGRKTTLYNAAQTGAVLDLTNYIGGNDFRWANDIGGFYIQGDSAADATKTHYGIKMVNVNTLYLHDISILETGGPGLYLSTETDCNHFERITVHQPIGASANNVPYVHLYGICNGNVFNNLFLRHPNPSVGDDGATACLYLQGDGAIQGPSRNKFYNTQTEFVHIPEGGSIVRTEGSSNEFYGYTDYDSAGTIQATLDTAYFRFMPVAYDSGDGNIFNGTLPVGLAGMSAPSYFYLAYGIIVESNGNSIIGPAHSYYGVLLKPGVQRNYVAVTGRSGTGGGYYVTDSSGKDNNVILDVPNKAMAVGRTTTALRGRALASDSFTRGNGALGVTDGATESQDGGAGLTWQFDSGVWTIATSKAVGTPTPGVEKVTNGDMETGSPPTGWNASANATLTADADAHAGSQALKIVSSVAGGGNASRSLAATTVGAWYLASAWAKRSVGSASFEVDQAANPWWVEISRSTVATSYTHLLAAFRARQTGLNVFVSTGLASETVFFDDVSVLPLTLSSLFTTVNTGSISARVKGALTACVSSAGLVARLDSAASPTTFIIAYFDGNGNVVIEECVAGTYAPLASAVKAFTTGDSLELVLRGATYTLYHVTAAGTETVIATGTTNVTKGYLHGLFSTHAGNTFAAATIWP